MVPPLSMLAQPAAPSATIVRMPATSARIVSSPSGAPRAAPGALRAGAEMYLLRVITARTRDADVENFSVRRVVSTPSNVRALPCVAAEGLLVKTE